MAEVALVARVEEKVVGAREVEAMVVVMVVVVREVVVMAVETEAEMAAAARVADRVERAGGRESEEWRTGQVP